MNQKKNRKFDYPSSQNKYIGIQKEKNLCHTILFIYLIFSIE